MIVKAKVNEYPSYFKVVLFLGGAPEFWYVPRDNNYHAANNAVDAFDVVRMICKMGDVIHLKCKMQGGTAIVEAEVK